MTDYQYIHFKEIGGKPKTSVWQCLSNRDDSVLGVVKWYGPWRQYCFFPSGDAVFNVGCLDDVNHFIRSSMKERVRSSVGLAGK